MCSITLPEEFQDTREVYVADIDLGVTRRNSRNNVLLPPQLSGKDELSSFSVSMRHAFTPFQGEATFCLTPLIFNIFIPTCIDHYLLKLEVINIVSWSGNNAGGEVKYRVD